MTERFENNDEVKFFTNTDPDCALKHKLRLSMQNVMLFGKKLKDPEVQEGEVGELTAKSILKMVNVSIVRE